MNTVCWDYVNMMQICYKPMYVYAGSEPGITDDSFQAVQDRFFLLGDNNSTYQAL